MVLVQFGDRSDPLQIWQDRGLLHMYEVIQDHKSEAVWGSAGSHRRVNKLTGRQGASVRGVDPPSLGPDFDWRDQLFPLAESGSLRNKTNVLTRAGSIVA